MPADEPVKDRTEPSVPGPMLRVLRGARADPPPIWLMRQAGRYLPEYQEVRGKAGGFLELCFDPQRAAEVTLQPVRRFGLDAAILFADILLIPMALGVDLRFETGEGPRLAPVAQGDDIDALKPAEAVDEALSPIAETVRRVRSELAPDKALIGFAGAPWTVATYMVEGGTSRDFALTRYWAMQDPRTFGRIIDRITEATIRYLSAQIDAGADAVQIFDSWAGVLAAEQLQPWVYEPTRRIVSALSDRHPAVPIIGFPRHIGQAVPDYVRETGVDVVGLDSSSDLQRILETVPPEIVLQGNLDPLWLQIGGVAMRREIERILDQLAGRPHVFNLGHGVIKETPPHHVAELVAAIRSRRPAAG